MHGGDDGRQNFKPRIPCFAAEDREQSGPLVFRGLLIDERLDSSITFVQSSRPLIHNNPVQAVQFHVAEVPFRDVHPGNAFTSLVGIRKANRVAWARRDAIAVFDVLPLHVPFRFCHSAEFYQTSTPDQLFRLNEYRSVPMPIEIRRKDLKTLVAQGRAQLLEVLPASAYKKEHLPQAVNIPLQSMNADTTRFLRKDVAVIVYCQDYQCDVSARAAWRLESMGFQEVYRYTGGKADWLAAGWETEGTASQTPRLKQHLQKDVFTCSQRERMEDVKTRRRPNQDICVVVSDRNIVLGAIRGEGARVPELPHCRQEEGRPRLEGS